ncbi:MAG: TerB family tellurite resistance protein [Rhodospirillaceae bacterium]
MSIWGKVIGGVAGFAMGGPLGALLGGVAGHHLYDKQKDQDEALMGDGGAGAGHGPDTEARQVAFTQAVIVLAAKMAKSDGVVSKDEILAFREVFHVPPEDEAVVGKLFNEARKDATGYEPYAEQIAMMFAREQAVLEELLAALFHIAKADGNVHPAELDFLRRTAIIFGFTPAGFERLKETYLEKEDDQDLYKVLGVAKSASNDEIKKAYRKLIRENHPDKLMADGMPQEFIDLANEKMALINAAYDQIEKERGF